MAQDTNTSGFNLLPTPNQEVKPTGGTGGMSSTTQPSTPPEQSPYGPRDMIVAGGILIVLIIAFFFVKNAFADSLVEKRIYPNKANMAGWGLFIFLTSAAVAGVLTVLNSGFVSFILMLPLALAAVVGLFLTYSNSRNQ